MKYTKIIAIAMIAVLSMTAFSGCVSRNRTDDNAASSHASVLPYVSSVPDFVSEAEEEIDRLQSDIERGMSGLDESEDELDRDNDILSGDARDNDLLRDESLPHASGDEISQSSAVSADESIASAMSTDFSEIGALNGKADTGFPGGPVDSRNRPGGPVAYQQKYGKYDAHFIIPNSDKIYLTFDEGYENGYTSKILDILKEKNVKAVFFITYPYAQSEPALVKRMIDEGHTLGNHSTKHQTYPSMPIQEAAKDLMKLHDYVLANYGYKMFLFRPPEGSFSEQTLALAQSLGYSTMLWSFAYKDYDVKNQPLAIEATGNIIKKAHPGEICLLHAVSRTNSEILGEVIDALRAKNFEFADYFYFK